MKSEPIETRRHCTNAKVSGVIIALQGKCETRDEVQNPEVLALKAINLHTIVALISSDSWCCVGWDGRLWCAFLYVPIAAWVGVRLELKYEHGC